MTPLDKLRELSATIAHYLEPSSTYYDWRPSMQDMQLILSVINEQSLLDMERNAGRLDWLQAQMLKGWADGFAMLPLDSGALYPRPWRKALEAEQGMTADLKTGAWLWQATVRDAIDCAMERDAAIAGGKEGRHG